jgi:hypothetical protein
MGTLLDSVLKGNGQKNAAKETESLSALAYLRVSKKERKEGAQRKDIEEWARENNVIILE